MRFYFEFHEHQGEGYLAHLHDPLAAAVALDPGLIRTRAATVAVELTGTLTRAMTIADWSGHWGRRTQCAHGRRRRRRRCSSSGSSSGSGPSPGGALTRRRLRGTTGAAGSTAAVRFGRRRTWARAERPDLRLHGTARPRIPPAFVHRPRPGPPAELTPVLRPAASRRTGSAVNIPRTVTRTGLPWESSNSTGSSRRTAGAGCGSLSGPRPVRGGPRHRLVAERGQGDPLGRPASAGLSTGTCTASWPSRPCTRTRARRARNRSSSPSPPHSGS